MKIWEIEIKNRKKKLYIKLKLKTQSRNKNAKFEINHYSIHELIWTTNAPKSDEKYPSMEMIILYK